MTDLPSQTSFDSETSGLGGNPSAGRLAPVLSALPIKLVALAQGIQGLGKTDDDVVLESIVLLLLSEQAGHSGCLLADVAGAPWVDWIDRGDGLDPGFLISELSVLEAALSSSGLLGEEQSGSRGPLVYRDGMLFRRSQYMAEMAWRGAIEERCDGEHINPIDPQRLETMLADVEATLGYELSPSKRAACQRLCSTSFGVLLGGPGTGKTTTLAALIELYHQLHADRSSVSAASERIVLLAPTGKAAQRMHESLMASPLSAWQNLCDVPSTVHRYLAKPPLYRPTTVIVDESSMIDVQLMERLLDNVPAGCKLLLVGDPYQLNSVSSGAVLRDVVSYCEEQSYPVVAELSESFRFKEGSGLHALAESIHAGVAQAGVATDDSVELVSCGDEAVAEEGLGKYRLNHVLSFPMDGTWAERWDWLGQSIVLCAQRRGPAGVHAINHRCALAFQERYAPHSQGKWYVGMPVMVRQNNYAEQVFNGDVGIVWHHPDDPMQLAIAFPTTDDEGQVGVRFINPYLLGELDMAYAITVHKSQGSEYDHVHVVLPHSSDVSITREWIYTAVTRAKSRVSLVGATDNIDQAIATATQRWTLANAT